VRENHESFYCQAKLASRLDCYQGEFLKIDELQNIDQKLFVQSVQSFKMGLIQLSQPWTKNLILTSVSA